MFHNYHLLLFLILLLLPPSSHASYSVNVTLTVPYTCPPSSSSSHDNPFDNPFNCSSNPDHSTLPTFLKDYGVTLLLKNSEYKNYDTSLVSEEDEESVSATKKVNLNKLSTYILLNSTTPNNPHPNATHVSHLTSYLPLTSQSLHYNHTTPKSAYKNLTRIIRNLSHTHVTKNDCLITVDDNLLGGVCGPSATSVVHGYNAGHGKVPGLELTRVLNQVQQAHNDTQHFKSEGFNSTWLTLPPPPHIIRQDVARGLTDVTFYINTMIGHPNIMESTVEAYSNR